MHNRLPLPKSADQPWALFLDVDGTLLELADHPNHVVVPDGRGRNVRYLHKVLDGALALVSGRNIATLDMLFDWRDFDAAGCHGGELRIAGTTETSNAGPGLKIIGDRLLGEIKGMPTEFLELKGESIALHHRSGFLRGEVARDAVKRVLTEQAEEFRVIYGKNVVEILAKHCNKGEAIRRFLATAPYLGRCPVFVGDDATDEDGFQEVNRRRGISIRVGENTPTAARFRASSVSEVCDWLDGPLLRRLEGRSDLACQNYRHS